MATDHYNGGKVKFDRKRGKWLYITSEGQPIECDNELQAIARRDQHETFLDEARDDYMRDVIEPAMAEARKQTADENSEYGCSEATCDKRGQTQCKCCSEPQSCQCLTYTCPCWNEGRT